MCREQVWHRMPQRRGRHCCCSSSSSCCWCCFVCSSSRGRASTEDVADIFSFGPLAASERLTCFSTTRRSRHHNVPLTAQYCPCPSFSDSHLLALLPGPALAGKPPDAWPKNRRPLYELAPRTGTCSPGLTHTQRKSVAVNGDWRIPLQPTYAPTRLECKGK